MRPLYYAAYVECGNGFIEGTSPEPKLSECDIIAIHQEIEKNKKGYNCKKISNLHLVKDNQIHKIINMFNTYGVVKDSEEIPSFIINQIVLLSNKSINDNYELLSSICREDEMRKSLLSYMVDA